MAREVLIVLDIVTIVNGKIGIVLDSVRDELRSQWINKSINDLKAQFEGKKIQVFGESYQFETRILSVEIFNSIEDIKKVLLFLNDDNFSRKIQLNDEVEVDL